MCHRQNQKTNQLSKLDGLLAISYAGEISSTTIESISSAGTGMETLINKLTTVNTKAITFLRTKINRPLSTDIEVFVPL